MRIANFELRFRNVNASGRKSAAATLKAGRPLVLALLSVVEIAIWNSQFEIPWLQGSRIPEGAERLVAFQDVSFLCLGLSILLLMPANRGWNSFDRLTNCSICMEQSMWYP